MLLGDEETGRRHRRIRLSLFWRTFFMLCLLLAATILAWLQSFRAMEFEPRTLHTAQQIASMVNLSRAALTYSDSIARVSLLKTLSEQEGMRIQPHEPTDNYELMDSSPLGLRLTQELKNRLGAETLVAQSVNGTPGLWISFRMGDDYTWLLMDNSRLSPVGGKTVALWLGILVLISLTGAAIITRLLNKPIRELSIATYKLREGDFSDSQLDEQVATSEIRNLNIGFNRMAEKLAKIEQDRAVMMAGISHDLRTPLARLRLETEMSVADDVAREHMVADIVQLDAIIDKFMDYARPVSTERDSVNLQSVVTSCVYSIQELGEMEIHTHVPGNLYVYADEVELARVVTNLLENARRYGKSPATGIATVDVTAAGSENHVLLKIRDHGVGVPEPELRNLLKPFFRGDAARTEAAGAGLGLSIVDKTVQRMGGRFALTNSSTGGLAAHIRLDRAPSNEQWSEEQRLQRPHVKRQARSTPFAQTNL
nr:ATP-binding protein [Corticibacter populi]